MADRDLDMLLSAPLEEVADAGFCARVVARTERRAWWHERMTLYAPVAAAAAIAPFLPLHAFTDAALRLSPQFANSGALALAAAAIILTLTADRKLREAA